MALVNYERDGQVVTLTLNRPEKLNAFSDELVGVLSDALYRFDTDDEAQIAILCGNGRAFSSGADVQQRQLRSREEFLKLGGPQGRGTHSADLLTKSVNWKPVIAAAHGYVLGLSVGIVLECDLIVAEEGTRFQITETSRGLGAGKYWALMHYRGGGAFTDSDCTSIALGLGALFAKPLPRGRSARARCWICAPVSARVTNCGRWCCTPICAPASTPPATPTNCCRTRSAPRN